jgi:hypothetical protein
MKRATLVLVVLTLALTTAPAHADIITHNIGGTALASGFIFGQSFTTPAGGPWHDLTFNFFTNVPPTTPTAAGTAFLLIKEYHGSTANLSSAPGLLAQTSNLVGGQWVFAPGVTVQPNTMYWIYEDTPISVNSGGNVITGGHLYFVNPASGSFQATTLSNDFRFSWDVVLATTPEPATLNLFGLGAVGMMGYAWRRRRPQAA